MKRKRFTFLASCIILFALLIYSFSTNNSKLEDSASSDVDEDNTIEVTEVPLEKTHEFTEGVSIKKFPGDFACFQFETPMGYRIICDPYNINELIHSDIVIESHSDSDHTDTRNLELPYELITDPGEYAIDDVVIKGYTGKHNKGEMSGPNNIYVITINDITIAHFASQGEVPSDKILDQIGKVDVLLIQAFINPDYNKLVIADTDIIISKLSPKIVIPEHAGSDAGKFLAKRLKVTEEFVDTGSIIITRSMLEKIEGIRVINLDTNDSE